MAKKQFYILLCILLILVLIFSNPSEESHIEIVKSKIKIAYNKKMSSEIIESENSPLKSIGNGLGLLLGDAFIDKLTDGLVTRDNYVLFSLTKVELEGEDRIIGFGFLGNVFLSDKIENIFQSNQQSKIQNAESIDDVYSSSSDKIEMSDNEFMENLPLSNPNSNKYEFTDDMLIDRYYFDKKIYSNKDNDFCFGRIINILDEFSGIEVKLSEPDTFFKEQGVKAGDTLQVYFQNVDFNGRSKMCKSCASDFIELIKKGRNIKFRVTGDCNNINTPATEYINHLSYINIKE